MTHRYRVYGLGIASEVELPEFAASPDRSGLTADVTMVMEDAVPVPPCDERPRLDKDEHGVTLTVHGVARYRVEGGGRVTVNPDPMATARSVRLFLLGSVIGIICHQRGLLPLHAGAVLIDGRAVAFCGHSGIGKSTLVSQMVARGHRMLCDDICVLSFSDREGPVAWPGPPSARLWRDAVEQLGHDCRELAGVMDDRDKYYLPFGPAVAGGPFPFRRLYMIRDGRDEDAPAFTRLTGVEAIQTVRAETYRKAYLEPMGLLGDNVTHALNLVQQVPAYAMHRRRGYDVLSEEIDMLERHLAQT